MPKKEKFYITTAIDYPNAPPHIGHAYEKIIADCLARWHRLLGKKVFFLTGTDENSLNIAKIAQEQGKAIKDFLEEIVPFFKKMCAALDISYNNFIRTTDAKHVQIVKKLYKKAFEAGEIYKGKYEGLYCYGCEAFLTEKDLVSGLCPRHKAKPEKISEESYFFRLSKYLEKIRTFILQHPGFILPKAREHEILKRLEEPLNDLSVSRYKAKWGIQVPFDKNHAIYVWFDALLNYISGIGWPRKQFQKLWPADVHVIGKDITWFHTVIWPCMLFALGLEPPKCVYVHGFLTYAGQKISKTLGNVIDPIYLAEKYGSDALRYFLLKEIPAGEDGDFSEEKLVERNNADLADELGNLVQRVAIATQKFFGGAIPRPAKLQKEDKEFVSSLNIFDELNDLMLNFQWPKALEKIFEIIHKCNAYLTATEPWKANEERKRTIIYCAIECLRIVSLYLWPFLPKAAEKIASIFGQKITNFKKAKFRRTTKGFVAKPEPLFKKFSMETDPFALMDLRIGQIVSVEPHPQSDRLYVLTVDLGFEKRQLVAGIKDYAKEDLIGKKIVVVANLKPATIRGIESKGMLLAAEKEGKIKLLEAFESSPGSKVFIESIASQPAPEIDIKTFQKIRMQVRNKKIVYNDKILKTEREEIFSDIEDGAIVK